jgi:hypothetical protein
MALELLLMQLRFVLSTTPDSLTTLYLKASLHLKFLLSSSDGCERVDKLRIVTPLLIHMHQ